MADLWSAPVDSALDTLGRIYADRSVLPGAGSSLPSMLMYLRDPERFGVCINATMRGLAEALGCQPFKADSRASYERFCESLREWRDRYGVAPQEADAVLTDLWRDSRGERQRQSAVSEFGDTPFQFLADLAAHNNGEWMQANQQRYRDELRQPFIALMEQVAARHLRELDPQLDTVVKTNRVLASIRKRFPDEAGEYHEYFWGAFSRGRKQEDVQLAVFVKAAGLEVSLYLGSAQAEHVARLREALAARGDELLAPLARYNDRLVWEVHGNREHPLEGPREHVPVTDSATALEWLDEGGTSIKWYIHRGDLVLDDANLADRIGELFRALHPLAAAACRDPLVAALPDSGDDEEGGEDEARLRLTIEQVAERCYLPAETVEEW